MLGRIAGELNGSEAHPSDRVLRRELISGQPWTGFLGAVEVAVTRRSPGGGGLFAAEASATVCLRFELHGEGGPRRFTIREIDCPPLAATPTTRT